ncbi:MAG: choice-of-anchor V domain-containing protein [Bacteroidota bacterium]
MLRLFLVLVVAVLIVLFDAPREAHSRSSGASAGVSGAPGDRTCASAGCHGDFELNSGTGSVTIEGPSGGYVAGAAYEFEVRVDNTTPGSPTPNQGFLVTARDEAGDPVGEFELVDAALTKFAAGGGTRYVTHTSAGISVSSWRVRWLAPDDAPARVTFYAAGNAANGNGWFDGDYIYTTATEVARSGVSADEQVPEVVVLDAVWPNPTRGAATLSFALAAPTDVTVTLVDGLGRTVVEAQRGALGAGAQTVALDASGLVPGVYFAAVTVGGGTAPESRRVLPLTVAR